MISVLWLCKTHFFANHLAQLLRAHNINVAAASYCPVQSPQLYKQTKAQIIIIDANWQKDDHYGLTILKTLKAQIPSVKAILVTTSYSQELCSKIQAAGAMGYFWRNMGKVEQIASCIKQVNNNRTSFRAMQPLASKYP